MPVKNGMPYLPQTLASLAAQTFKDFEVLVWDNGSNDGTVEELQRWIPNRLSGQIVTGKARSVGGSLAGLVDLADTEFCARIDADDICQPDRLLRQIDFLRSNTDISLVGSQGRVINQTGRPTGEVYVAPLRHDDIVNTLLVRNPICHPTVMFRRSAVLNVGNYDGSTVFEDYDLWLRFVQHYRMANISECLVDYRIHEKSVMHSIIKEAKSYQFDSEVINSHAPTLFGLSVARTELLLSKRRLFTLLDAIGVARYLARTQGGTTVARLRSPSFANSWQTLTRTRDIPSRIAFAVLNAEPGSLVDECRSIGRKILTKLRRTRSVQVS